MTATTTTTTTRLDLDFVVMTADFVVWSKILVEVTVNRVCTTAGVCQYEARMERHGFFYQGF